MKLLLVLAAERILVDSRSGKVTAINLIEDISSVTFPYLVITPFILASFQKETGDPEETEATLVFMVDDQEIGRSSFIIEFSGHPRTRSILELNALVIPKPGRLKICVQVGDTTFGDWDIYVRQASEDRPSESEAPAGARPKRATPRTASRRTKRQGKSASAST